MNQSSLPGAFFTACLLAGSTSAWSMGMGGEPLLTKVTVDQLEMREHSGADSLNWEGDAWFGGDIHKLWIKTEGEYRPGELEESEWQLLYRRAITPFGDLQVGVRHQQRPGPEEQSFVVGWTGLWPYFIEADLALFVGDGGDSSVRLKLEQEWMISQKVELVPHLELNAYGFSDDDAQQGTGIGDLSFDLQLRYRMGLKLKPYIGVHYGAVVGDTADRVSAAGERTSQWQGVAGINFWF